MAEANTSEVDSSIWHIKLLDVHIYPVLHTGTNKPNQKSASQRGSKIHPNDSRDIAVTVDLQWGGRVKHEGTEEICWDS